MGFTQCKLAVPEAVPLKEDNIVAIRIASTPARETKALSRRDEGTAGPPGQWMLESWDRFRRSLQGA